MIKTIIFDFGDVFINLDKEGAMTNALELFEIEELSEELIAFNSFYEQGLIDTDEFIDFYMDNFPKLSKKEITEAWNYIICDFPSSRLEFIQQLAKDKKYNLILLSNTNALHIECIQKHISFYDDFKNAFNKFYLSHEIQLRKPNADIFQFVLDQNKLKPEECLFIDDTKENTDAASTLGINVWNNDPKTQDIIDLFTIKKELF
ncbi:MULTISPECIES: HAD family hydrolase [Olleya]|uniref:Putative hydrolase of the HAD superfamily n=1 Tax=Olleya namhaensis TaxID=1144750 RepID=A0A1I3QL21_9FLAO|nr:MULTISPECIES: HAD family phosphatase [Olleya]PKG52425.1 HAD family phosphatase [Olleya sp. 1-3]SFJ34738.1 putative hydrolase of the HAD superfamily [Olleya namhaensis]